MATFKCHPQAAIVLATVLVFGFCASAVGVPFAGGTGTPGDPYQVATAEQLISIAADPVLLGGYFVLVNDINLDPNLPGGQVFEWALIAPDASNAGFTGTFDGGGFKVLHLTITAAAGGGGPLGLFGRIGPSGRVRNLGLENAAVHGGPDSNSVAALVGSNAGRVQTCYTTGLVDGGSKVGGLCGENSGLIRSCYSTASVSGNAQVGGLAGRSNPVGYSRARPGSAASAIGGIVNCYAGGTVAAQESGGGLIGECVGMATSDWDASFWDIEASGLKVSAGGLGLTTAQMKEAVIFAGHGWDQDPNWVIDDGRDYPRLAWEKTGGQSLAGVLSEYLAGAGTVQDPYRISTAEQFALIGLMPSLLDKHFVLEADLDLAHFAVRPMGEGASLYSGFFHGNGHVLRNVCLAAGEASAFGLFGRIGLEGRVSNLGLENVVVTPGPTSLDVGALAGTNDGTITGCYAIGSVTAGQGKHVGGLVGSNAGRVMCSYSAVRVAGPLGSGSLIGRQVSPGLVFECYASGGTAPNGGGHTLVGVSDGLGLVANSYFLKKSDGLGASPSGFPLDEAQMRQRESFAGWDFVGSSSDGSLDRWFMPDANYPVLAWQADLQGLRPIPDVSNLSLEWARAEIELAGFVAGDTLYDYHSTIAKEHAIVTSPLGPASPGSVISVVLSRGQYLPPSSYDRYGNYPLLIPIETPGQMEYFAGTFSGSFNLLLTRDIDMAGWEVLPPRATSPSRPRALFAGTFLGNGHKLSNLRMFRGGLFNEIAPEGLVHGVVLENVVVASSASDFLGALAAVNQGTILNCSVHGTVLGTGVAQNLGGLVGENDGIISECCAVATIRGPLRDSEAPWGIIGPPGQGGLVGVNRYTIVDCYAAGDISGAGYVGGLVGRNFDPISRCYAITRVTDQGAENAGGLVGSNASVRWRPGRGSNAPPPGYVDVPVAVTDCYFLSAASGGGPDNGCGTALQESQMQQQASFTGWDFMSTWTICEGQGYPRLQWEGVACESER